MSNDKIAEIAYSKWERAGRPNGRHEEFWLAAEKEYTEDQELNTEVRVLWQMNKDHHDAKIQNIWKSVKCFLKL